MYLHDITEFWVLHNLLHNVASFITLYYEWWPSISLHVEQLALYLKITTSNVICTMYKALTCGNVICHVTTSYNLNVFFDIFNIIFLPDINTKEIRLKSGSFFP